MPQVILFNHMPKTAGSTMRYVLWRTVGRERVLVSTTLGEHPERLREINAQLRAGTYAVVTHIGWGVQDHIEGDHTFSAVTLLRDPIQRTISRYLMAAADGEADGTLLQYLEQNPLQTYNAQTAFFSGIWARHHVDGEEFRRAAVDEDALARAKANLEKHDVVGQTERFDEFLLGLQAQFRWPTRSLLHSRANTRRHPAPPTPEELKALRVSNRLDQELYDFATEIAYRAPAGRLARFRRLNRAYGRGHGAYRSLREQRRTR